jgi:hypothetical protein
VLRLELRLFADQNRGQVLGVGVGLLDLLLGAEGGGKQRALTLRFESAAPAVITASASATCAFCDALRALIFSIAAWAPARLASACATRAR